MWGTCCMCAAMFTFDGPRVLGSSCLATGAATGWTVTKLKTSNRREDTARALNDTPLPPVVPPQPYRCLLMGQLHLLDNSFKNRTFARAHILINKNLQLSVCFDQTSLSSRRHEFH